MGTRRATRFHPRRTDKDMPDSAEQLAVIRSQRFLTMAMCREDEPYLVSLNYAYDHTARCFFLHCAIDGKKLDFLRANARVWGQIVEDHGYEVGSCSHKYRTVMFEGRAEIVEDQQEKLDALAMLIDQLDPQAEAQERATLARLTTAKVGILRVQVTAMSGKQSPAPKKK
jgi:uncharacterized protein